MSTLLAAVVTGAGSGIGRATALLLAKRGYALVLSGRNERSLDETRGMIADAGRVLIVRADMGVQADVELLIDRAAAHFGRLDVLVNNAGAGRHIAIERTTPALVRELFDINAAGPAFAILRAWPHFQRQRSGCVVNVSSMSTIDPFPGFFAYAASKAPMNLMVDSIAKEGAAIGVIAFAVAPGAVETPLLRANFDEATIPRALCLSPDDVAHVIVQCASGERKSENGRTIGVVRDDRGVRDWALPRPSLERGYEMPAP